MLPIKQRHTSLHYVCCIIPGQECCLLTDVQPVGSVLATTTASVVLIQRPDSLSGSGEGGVGVVGMGGHHLGSTGLTCRLLKPPQGILGGIGRRVSTLLWGSGVTAADEDSVREKYSFFILI